MAIAGPSVLMIAVAMLMGGVIGLPVSVPPLPPDPIVQRALPDECLLAVNYHGFAKPDPGSKNETEQLLAEEEVQQFVGQIGSEILKVVRQKAAGEPMAEGLAAELPGVLHTLATRPLALYLSSVQMSPTGPDIRGGLVVNAGSEAKSLADSLNKIQTMLLANGPPDAKIETLEIAGVKFSKLPTPPQAPVLVWGFKQSFLLVAVGEDSPQELVARLSDKNRKLPGWYTSLQKQVPLARVCSTSYINVAGILKAAEPAMTDPKIKPILAALGIDKVRSLGSVSGMSATGMSSNAWLALDGEPAGIFALASTEGITADDLSIIPADVVMAYMLKLDLSDLYQNVLDGVAMVEPAARNAAEAQLKQLETNVGLTLEADLLKPLGDTWSVFSTPGSGIGIPTGLAATASLRDREKFAATHEKLLVIARGAIAQASQGKVTIKEGDYKGNHLYYLQGVGNAAMPVSPTWCLTKDRLIVTLYPQMMKTLLGRSAKDESLADNPEVRSLLSNAPPAVLGYQDTAAMLTSTYSMYQVFAPMIQGQLAGQGLEVELPTLPAQASVLPHVKPMVTTLRRVKGGLLFGSTYTLPVAGGVDPSTAGIGVALLLPAVQAAREAARRNVSQNNLKQIMLSMHNHHDANKSLPAAAITDKEGKPLLSRRVTILPYLEENQLYQEFHLDEPWDSEHNKKLIPRMPTVYVNPSRDYKGDGTTTYLVPTGDAGLFKDLAKGVKFREVTDGLSKTIAAVEVTEDHAVPWTKPDDLKIDPKRPLAGLKGARVGGFLAALADGSVRMIADDIDPTFLTAMFTPDGGEAEKAP